MRDKVMKEEWGEQTKKLKRIVGCNEGGNERVRRGEKERRGEERK